MTERIEDIPATPRSATLNIHQRLLAVMEAVGYVQKEEKMVNNQYRFVSHDAVTAKIRPALIKNRVLAIPRTVSHAQDGNRTEATVEVDFINVDKPEDRITVPMFGYGIDPQDKGPGKAISYAVKYACLKALSLETGDDPERDAIEYKPADKPEETAPRTRSTRANAAASAEVTEEQKVELKRIGNSLIDLVNEERENVSVDHSYTMWEMVETMDQDRLLWLSLYLDKHPRVLTRLKAVMVEERRKLRAAAASAEGVPVTA